MSIRSFQGAEIYRLASEMMGNNSASIVRDTSIKVTGAASWKLSSFVSDFFETADTKAATDVIAACSFNFRLTSVPLNLVYRICTAGADGGNSGRWYLGHEARQLKLYKNDGTVQDTGTTLDTTWHHIMLMDDGTTAYVYINGNTTPDMTWVHGQGAWNAKAWGPSALQIVGKNTIINHWFDDVCCFDDQDGRMDWITPSDWDGSTAWRVERATPNAGVETGFNATGTPHWGEVDEDVPDTSSYVWVFTSHSGNHIVREGVTDYEVPPAAGKWGFTHDTTPAGNEWTDAIYNALAHGFEDTTDSVKEMMGLLNTSDFTMGSEHIRAVRYHYAFETDGDPIELHFYNWRDTVLIGPDDPAAPATTFVPVVIMY